MDPEVKHVENEACKVEWQKQKGCLITASIWLKPALAQKCYKKAVKEVNKHISIPGFRKGKAPDAVVLSKYADSVEREWKEEVMQEALRNVFHVTQLLPFQGREGLRKTQWVRASQEEGCEIQVAYEFFPPVPSIDFSAITLPPSEPEAIKEEEVEQVLQQTAARHGSHHPVEEGASAVEGNYVSLNVELLNVDPPALVAENRRYHLDTQALALWFYQPLLGLKAGAMVEIESPAEGETPSQRYRVHVQAIETFTPSPIDATLAEKEKCSSVEELRESIRTNLKKEKQEAWREQQIEILHDALLHAYPFDLPESLLRKETEIRQNRLLAQMGEDLSEEERQEKKAAAATEAPLQADRALRLLLLQRKIAETAHLEVTEEEMRWARFQEMLMSQMHNKQYNSERTEEQNDRMRFSLLCKKASHYALDRVLGKPVEEKEGVEKHVCTEGCRH